MPEKEILNRNLQNLAYYFEYENNVPYLRKKNNKLLNNVS